MKNIAMILDNEFTGDMRVENEVISLQKAGFQVYVLCLNHGEKASFETFNGAKILRISISLFFKNKTKGFANTFLDLFSHFWAYHLKKMIKKYNIDVVHAHDLYMLKAAFIATKNKKIPVVADLHENYPEALKNYKYTKTFPGNLIISIPKWEKSEIEWLNKADKVITVIEEAVERYKKLGVNTNKISVVPNYVNLEVFNTKINLPEISAKFSTFKTATYIGGFDYHRGLESIIKGVPLIVEAIPNFKLILVGTGKNENELKELANQLNINNHISFEGWQSPDSLASYIDASNICLIPHLKSIHTDNTIPHKLFQYMLMEKPVFSSNCAPLERIINASSCGEIFLSGDSNDFASKIISSLKNDEQLKSMGISGKKAVLERYNWDAAAVNLIDLYKNI